MYSYSGRSGYMQMLQNLSPEQKRIVRAAAEEARRQLRDDSFGAAFGGGFGAALFSADEYEDMSDDEILLEAQERNLSLSRICWRSCSSAAVCFEIL